MRFRAAGDNAGRKAAWRALENTPPVLADGKNARFLFLPDGEDPDDFVRKRGKAAFEAALAQALPLSEFLLRELASQHPPADALEVGQVKTPVVFHPIGHLGHHLVVDVAPPLALII